MQKITFLLFMCAFTVYAQPTVTLKATAGNCTSNGKIQVTATNTQGTVLYQLVAPSPVTTVTQSSNLFSNLPSGTYTVAVYDDVARATPVKKTVSLTNSYPMLELNTSTVGTNSAVLCGPNGTINASVKYNTGRSPFTYELTAGPETRPSQTSSLFENLPAGTYTVTVTDACGTSKSNTATVTNGVNFTAITFTSFATGMTFNYTRGATCKDLIISPASVYIKDTQNKSYSLAAYPFNTRIEFPAGSGNYTDWTTTNKHNVDLTGQTTPYNFVLQVQHPCTGEIFSSVQYNVPPTTYDINLIAYYDMCRNANRGLRVTLGSGLKACVPITLDLSRKDIPENVKTYNFNTQLDIPPADLDSLATYVFKFTDNLGVQTTKEYKYGPNISGIPNSIGFLARQNCTSFTGNDIVLNTFDSNGPYPVKITIVSGPDDTASLPPVVVDSYTGANNKVYYSDMPSGAYQFKVEYGSCRTQTKSYTIEPRVKDLKLLAATVTAGTSGCGYYNVSISNSYTAGSPTIPMSVSFLLKILEGPSSKVSTTTISNSFANLVPGTYKVGAFFNFNGAYSSYCSDANPIATISFTLPDYTLPVVNLKQSGGVVCGANTTGTLHVSASGLEPMQYRIKKKTDPDTAYSAYQSSPDFTELSAGDYTVQIKDGCITPSVTTQSLSIVSASGSQSLTVTNTIQPGLACKGSTIKLTVKPIGPYSKIEWYLNDEPITNGLNVDQDILEVVGFGTANEGNYKVKVTYLSGCEMESQQLLKLAPNGQPADVQIDDVTTCTPTSVTLKATSSAVANPTFRWYADAALTELLFTGASYTTGKVTAVNSYYVTVSSPSVCENLTLEAKKVTVTYDDSCICYKPAITSGEMEPFKTIISTLDRAVVPRDWSYPRTGSLILESNNRGLVLTRIANPETAIINPIEGMLVYDIELKVLKFYNGTEWKPLTKQGCPDY